MSGRKIENGIYNVDTDWKDETESKDVLKYGLDSLDFSQMNTTTIPEILSGSSIDVDGVFYRFDADEAITGSPADGVTYVVITGGLTAVASFTNTALPAYDFSKKGYYGVGGERYVLKVTKSGGSYSDKIQLSKNYFSRDTEVYGSIYSNTSITAKTSIIIGSSYQTEIKDRSIELGANSLVDSTSFIDFHATPSVDKNTRMRRYEGVNGIFVIDQVGSGAIELVSGANKYASFSNTEIQLLKPVTIAEDATLLKDLIVGGFSKSLQGRESAGTLTTNVTTGANIYTYFTAIIKQGIVTNANGSIGIVPNNSYTVSTMQFTGTSLYIETLRADDGERITFILTSSTTTEYSISLSI